MPISVSNYNIIFYFVFTFKLTNHHILFEGPREEANFSLFSRMLTIPRSRRWHGTSSGTWMATWPSTASASWPRTTSGVPNGESHGPHKFQSEMWLNTRLVLIVMNQKRLEDEPSDNMEGSGQAISNAHNYDFFLWLITTVAMTMLVCLSFFSALTCRWK